MIAFRRRRPDRARSGGFRPGVVLEQLERREVLSSGIPSILQPTLLVHNTGYSSPPQIYGYHPMGTGPRQLALLDNMGKVVTGKTRQGDEWQITVHGPGAVVVTDLTPNDGALDDGIDTIQLIGTDPHRTYVTGNVVASARLYTDGTVVFHHLIADNGVASIVLNGFDLGRTLDFPIASPPTPEIYLPGGTRYLQFHDIIAPVDPLNEPAFTIAVGDAQHPLSYKPSIRFGSVFNTITTNAVANPPVQTEPGLPATIPTVNIIVNGEIRDLTFTSATQSPIDLPGFADAFFPQTTTTGRTSIQALGIDRVSVAGSLRNTTFSRAATGIDPLSGLPNTIARPAFIVTNPPPFSSGLTGMNHLGAITVGGVTDGLGIDVSRGPIGRIRLDRGLGDPSGYLQAPSQLGTPVSQYGYPAFGLYGGLIVANRIGSLRTGPANTIFQPALDPDFAQVRTGSTRYLTRPGATMTNGAIVTDSSIGAVNMVGTLFGSEIMAGANYASLIKGLQPVRQASAIGPLRIRGDLVDSVVSSTYRVGPSGFYGQFDPVTGTTDNEAGPGLIRGNLVQGALYSGGRRTILNHSGAGFYARTKLGYLPPPVRPKYTDSVFVGP